MAGQHTHARNLMKVIRDRIENGESPIHGYNNAASMVLPNGQDYAKTYGQACSLIDAASFVAGWPMLAMQMIRKPDGAINPESFTSDSEPWNNEVKSVAESHQ